MRCLHIFLLIDPRIVVFGLTCMHATSLALCTAPPSGDSNVNLKRISSQNVRSPETALNSSTGSDDGTDKEPPKSFSQQDPTWNQKFKTAEMMASRLGAKPLTKTSQKTWKRAFRLVNRVLPLLHSTDNAIPPNSNHNLACMWWKGLAGNDKSSPVYDNGLAYDLLPSGWRKIIRPRQLYPRFHHALVEYRTAYLDSQIIEIVGSVREEQGKLVTNAASVPKTKIRMVCMGAGYDTRGVKMIERNLVDQVIELDLPEVVAAKERLFRRLVKRRPWLKEISMPILVPSDFNDPSDVEEKLNAMLLKEASSGDEVTTEWHTIFVFEAVMLYLNENMPSSLLRITSRILRENSLKGSLCFADQLENVPGDDFDIGVKKLKESGWNLKDWCPKPGYWTHMGYASLSPSA